MHRITTPSAHHVVGVTHGLSEPHPASNTANTANLRMFSTFSQTTNFFTHLAS
jgi:hypothetical protein